MATKAILGYISQPKFGQLPELLKLLDSRTQILLTQCVYIKCIMRFKDTMQGTFQTACRFAWIRQGSHRQ
ncbi:MAG: hypothetical protein CMJ70_15920 [Planctomycetaceae bacterium]|nr:hypothetical protein [Planctomycetaceae bacterium]